MDFLDYVQDQFGPVADDKERSVSVEEEWYVQNTAVLVDELFETYPLLMIDVFVYYVDFFVVGCESNLLFILAYVREDILSLFIGFMLLFFFVHR